MTNPRKPAESIVPIFAIDKNRYVKRFLGTGVFCNDPCVLATADHVIRDWKESFAISILGNLGKLYDAHIILRNPESDLAILDVPEYTPPFSFPLAKGEIGMNQIVFNFEYGTTQVIGNTIILGPATRLGNVTRIIDLSERYGLAGKDILELSFPALRGASGSPVINSLDYSLFGIIIANVSYHLLPAQIESVLNEHNKAEEEIKYMLPQGLAVNVKHLRDLIDNKNI